jgi:hypothetical protein
MLRKAKGADFGYYVPAVPLGQPFVLHDVDSELFGRAKQLARELHDEPEFPLCGTAPKQSRAPDHRLRCLNRICRVLLDGRGGLAEIIGSRPLSHGCGFSGVTGN